MLPTQYISKQITLLILLVFIFNAAFSQTILQREIIAKKIPLSATIKIDGEIAEPEWTSAQSANKFIALRPEPFIPESPENATDVKFLYSNDGIYIGGYFHEKNKDSIASELIGRDGFGNNDFVGIIFDTYNDKINGFEYFLTPLGEQMDAKMTNGGNEDFSWNAVWEGASKIQADGWSFEIFLPFSAIRYGNKKEQLWGLNIVRRRQKSGQQLFWQSINPNVNGFLTQGGLFKGIENIKPPLRLQFSPYFSTYAMHDDNVAEGMSKTSTSINGGMDVKYGINQAFTLDMTLIPDFGQVQADNRVLNLTPFEQQFAENRTFFTEGTELFSKGNLFYSRRIGGTPIRYYDVENNLASNEKIIRNPSQSKLLNATKISGRTQKGFGVGVLNAITQQQFAIIENSDKQQRRFETEPLTNYNILVLDQTLKNNSSISLVNTNVLRSGDAYDANVSSFLFNMNDKTNTWNVGGQVGASAVLGEDNKNKIGYTHSIYFGKTSGRFNFNFWQDFVNDKYDKSDMGYFTNNNFMDQGIWAGYKWLKPTKWYNQIRLNVNLWHSRLVSPIDLLRRKEFMHQSTYFNINGNAQTKKLWEIGSTFSFNTKQNDFYEPRVNGRVFTNSGSVGLSGWWNSNSTKKYSWGGNGSVNTGGVFKSLNLSGYLWVTARFNSKFSVSHSTNIQNNKRQAGWAYTKTSGMGALHDQVIFSKRNLSNVENVLNIKYSFTNKMGITFRARHYWSKVLPKEFFELDTEGKLQAPQQPFTENVNQNYNYLSVDMLFNWQFAQGSFLSFVWKDMAENFERSFENTYFNNLGKTLSGPQFNSISLRVIYFIDYLTAKNKLRKR